MIELKNFIFELQKELNDKNLGVYGEVELELNCATIDSKIYVIEYADNVRNSIKIKFNIL